VSQRGARAPEARNGSVALERRFGALTLRRVERPAAVVSYDFVEHLIDARFSRVMPGQLEIVCPWETDRFQCPQFQWNFVRAQTVEVDLALHRGLLAQPVGGAEVIIEYPAVPLGRELVVATGMHDVWSRKSANGEVDLRVVVAGTPQAAIKTTNDSGWQLTHIDSSAYAGRVVPVRFVITSAAPYQRQFVLAAEARR
jgi:hypothetical protein